MKKIDAYSEEFKTKFEKFLIGCDAIEEMEDWDKETLGEMDVFYQTDLVSIILRLIAADGEISEKEVEYLNKNLGFTYSAGELRDIYRNCRDALDDSFDEQFVNGLNHMRSINEKLANAYRELLLLACNIIIESDDVVTSEEIAEAERLKRLV